MKIIRPNCPPITITRKITVTESEKELTTIKKDDIVKIKNDNDNNNNIVIIVKDVKKENSNTIFIEPESIEGIEAQTQTQAQTEIKKDEYNISSLSLIDDILPKINKEEEEEKKVTFEITLTKRQKEIFENKGGVKWLKQLLTGTVKVKKGKKK